MSHLFCMTNLIYWLPCILSKECYFEPRLMKEICIGREPNGHRVELLKNLIRINSITKSINFQRCNKCKISVRIIFTVNIE